MTRTDALRLTLNALKLELTQGPLLQECHEAIAAAEEALAQPERTGWPAGLLQDDDRKLSKWLASKSDAKHVVDMAQPEHRALQSKGEHPAPCVRHCEANAFQSVIKNLQAHRAEERNFCPSCGKRLASGFVEISIHTCTPPQIAADPQAFYGFPQGSVSTSNAGGKCVTAGETAPIEMDSQEKSPC